MVGRLFAALPGPSWAYGIALSAVVIAVSFGAGWTVRSWKCNAAQLKAVQAAQKERERLQDLLEESSMRYEMERYNAGQAYADKQAEIRTYYRDRVVRTDCSVPDDVARVLADSVNSANARTGR